MYCVSQDRQGGNESRLELINLFLCDCWNDREAESDTRSHRNKGCIIYSYKYSYVFCPIVSSPLGHRENSSICDFKPQSSVPFPLQGKTVVS